MVFIVIFHSPAALSQQMLHAWALCMWGMENASWVSEHKNTELLSWESTLTSLQVPGILNSHLKIKSGVCLRSPVGFLFPESRCHGCRSGARAWLCKGSRVCLSPSSLPPLPQQPGRPWPSIKDPGMWHTRVWGLHFTGVKALQKSCLGVAAVRKKKSAATDKISVFKLNKVMRSTAGGSTGRKDLSASFALLFNASSFIINCYLLQMLKLVKRLIWNSLDSVFLKHNAHVSACVCVVCVHLQTSFYILCM